MSDDKAFRVMGSGEVWAPFCDELKALGAEILRPTAPKAPVDLAEARRFLTRMMRSAFELIVESGDAAVPARTVSLHETMKLAWDNPDNIHHNAYVSEAFEYRLFGRRGEAQTVTFAIYGGSYGKREQGRDTVAFPRRLGLVLCPGHQPLRRERAGGHAPEPGPPVQPDVVGLVAARGGRGRRHRLPAAARMPLLDVRALELLG